jgi:hypothetical protein
VVTLVTTCDKTVMGLLDGKIFHSVINGRHKHTMKKDPNVFKRIFKWVNGNVMVSVVMNPVSH